MDAKKQKIKNFSVLCSFKLVPPALKFLSNEKDIKIDGFLLPGHASVVLGSDSYDYLKVPGVIAGFGGAEIIPLWPFPIGHNKSITLVERT